jgi:hypothetical protein
MGNKINGKKNAVCTKQFLRGHCGNSDYFSISKINALIEE